MTDTRWTAETAGLIAAELESWLNSTEGIFEGAGNILTVLADLGLLIPLGTRVEERWGYQVGDDVFGRTLRREDAERKLQQWLRQFPHKPAKLVSRPEYSTPWIERSVSNVD